MNVKLSILTIYLLHELTEQETEKRSLPLINIISQYTKVNKRKHDG